MTGKPAPAVQYSLLIDAEDRTVEDIVNEFSTKIPRSLHDAFCSALVTLLEDTPKFLKPTERLVAFALLYHSYASANPYVSLLMTIAKDAKTDTYEKSFIRHLLGGTHEVLKLSAADYIVKFDSAVNSFPLLGPLAKQPDPFTRFFKNDALKNVLPDLDIGPGDQEETLTGLIQSSSLDALYTHWARPGPPKLLVLEGELIRVNPENTHGPVWDIGPGDQEETLTDLIQSSSLDALYTHWTRPGPPKLLVLEGELIRANPVNTHSPVWDLGTCADTSYGAVVRDLILQALKGPLAAAQQERFLLELTSDPSLVCHSGLSPRVLARLVKTNPLITVEVLIKLLMYPREISDYLMVLVNMDLSLSSMEVVNRLTASVELPTEFVHMYISHCISSCENTKDKYTQCQLVQLVCVFLQSLIKNKIIDVEDVFNEVEAFCIAFSTIREATSLSRLLKTFA